MPNIEEYGQNYLFEALNQEKSSKEDQNKNISSRLKIKANMFHKDYDKNNLKQFQGTLASKSYQNYSGIMGHN